MYHQLINNYHIKQFDSIDDMINYVSKTWDKYVEQRDKHHTLYDKSFLGRSYTSIDQVFRDLTTPWPEGLAIVERMLKQFENEYFEPPSSLKRIIHWNDDDGDELCIDRLKTGQSYWRTTRRGHRPGPINVTLITDIPTPGFKDVEDVLWRGAASIAITSLLEKSGYRVTILASNGGSSNAYKSGKKFGQTTVLKNASDFLDISTLVNSLSGWAYRTIYFASTYQEGECKYANLMGHCISPRNYLQWVQTDDQTLICEDVWSYSSAVNWIKQQLEKFASGKFTIQS